MTVDWENLSAQAMVASTPQAAPSAAGEPRVSRRGSMREGGRMLGRGDCGGPREEGETHE
jgi:hypothetical protein